ncbi:hypothetical protein AB0J82_00175 [Asanoa sp. NPDC049518]|uniref:hypothetical protein n=1 Tax=unclassified Asanoa TaxID=2685164 RepID=UPI00341C4EC4
MSVVITAEPDRRRTRTAVGYVWRWRILACRVMGSIVVVLGAFVLVVDPAYSRGWLVEAFGLYLLVHPWLFAERVRRQSGPFLDLKMEYEFDAQGLHSRNELSDSSAQHAELADLLRGRGLLPGSLATLWTTSDPAPR